MGETSNSHGKNAKRVLHLSENLTVKVLTSNETIGLKMSCGENF
jgi:hypothetical protein